MLTRDTVGDFVLGEHLHDTRRLASSVVLFDTAVTHKSVGNCLPAAYDGLEKMRQLSHGLEVLEEHAGSLANLGADCFAPRAVCA